MTISERERHRLHQTLDEVIGPDVAAILMSHLPPVGWADVATKHDLAELEGRLTNQLRATKHDLIELEGRLTNQLRAAISDLRTELHADLHTEIGGLRRELHTEIGSLRSDVHASLQSMARTYLLGNIALVLTVVAVVFGAAQLV